MPDTVHDIAVPGFEVIRRLGQGQVGDVYLARHDKLRHLVALKVARPEVVADAVARSRFEREGQAAARLRHPGIVKVDDVVHTTDARPVLVMQYIKGRSLEDRLAAEGPLSVGEARRVVAEVAEALEMAHRHGIVHRDLRPGNVLEDEETKQVLITDFGLAALLESGDGSSPPKLTATGQLVGDVRFMSPEQLRGERVTEQADVYQLGVLAYYLLTGAGPFGNPPQSRLLVAHLKEEPQGLGELRPEVDPVFADLVGRCLAKEPRRRPTTGDIGRRLRGQGADLAVPEPGGVAGLLHRRLPQFVVGSAVLGLGVMEVTSGLIQNSGLAPFTYDLAVVLAIHLVVATSVLSWFHGARGKQKVEPVEILLLSVVALSWIAVSVTVVVFA